MRNFTKALAAAAIAVFAVLVSAPSWAQNFSIPTLGSNQLYSISKYSGKQIEMSSSATSGAVDFGFFADWVSVCVAGNQSPAIAPSNKILARFGASNTASTGAVLNDPTLMTISATSMTIMENGSTGAGTVKGSAMVFSSPATTGVSPACQTFPFRTRGMVFASSTNATVNVIGFSR